MSTVVVTDSSPPPTPSASPGAIVVVPITILLANEQVTDPSAAGPVHEALERGQPIKTRAPSVMDYLDAIEGSDAEAAVIVTPAAEVTAMWRHAAHAPLLADRPVEVVDSRTAASGQTLVIEAAAQAAAGGGALAEVAEAARAAADRVRVIGAVGTVEPLVSSGMVDRAQVAGSWDRRPRATLFEARQGLIDPVRVLDDEDVPAALAELHPRTDTAGSPVVFTSADPPDRLLDMAHRLAELAGSATPPQACGPAMSVYTGRDVLGLAWLDTPSPRDAPAPPAA